MDKFFKLRERSGNLFAGDGEGALYHRWRRKIFWENNWFRLYWFGIFTLLIIAIFVIRINYLEFAGKYSPYSTERLVWMIVIVGFSLIARTQLLSLPTFIALEDFDQSRWETLKATPLTASGIMSVMLKNALVVGVLPVTFILLAETLAIGPPMQDSNFVYENININFSELLFMILAMIAYGFNITALAMIFGILIRRPFGAVIGALSPLIYWVCVTVVAIILRTDTFSTGKASAAIFDYSVLLSGPEGFFAQVWTEDYISSPSGEEFAVSTMATWLTIAAVILWTILHFVLKKYRSASR